MENEITTHQSNDIIEYPLEIIDDGLDEQAAADIEEARQTYKELITAGKEGLAVATTLVEGSEHPRAIEVFSNLINSIAGINGKLIELHEAKQKMRAPKKEYESSQITNNNVFVGSPADLLKLMEQSDA